MSHARFSGPASRLTSRTVRSAVAFERHHALLALGQTGEESAQRSATGKHRTGGFRIASEAISSQLGGASSAFGISHFRVGPSSRADQQTNSIASVTIEQQVSRGLVLPTSGYHHEQYSIQIEYTINREFHRRPARRKRHVRPRRRPQTRFK